MTLDDLRAFAVARSLFPPTTLPRALDRLGFVQADPIRAPARAQDLTLRHRVNGYLAGDLERRYPELDVEEDFFVIYGFVTRRLYALMHPRASGFDPFPRDRARHARDLLRFVRTHGEVHPRVVNDHFAHGTTTNYWGGRSNATTHLLDQMHYRGMLRVARRERGVRIYRVREHAGGRSSAAERRARVDALVDAVVNLYAPLPAASFGPIVRRLRYAVPQWRGELDAALRRARGRLAHARVEGVDWFWPAGERPDDGEPGDAVRLLAPFDPVVWDRRRFELLWGWSYRFEAYTPPKKRLRGYYALPLLWRDRVVGWGNLAVNDGRLRSDVGYAGGRPPRDRGFSAALDGELDRMSRFLGL
ncbi:MAG TPA: crosslink repair DNA glycosylase YcaQ family protein [Vicinamibacterales bacterium]|nr:crosslink repair DNA glycosylase YcaQ family protein [Vicinamibacterales bacterium]